MAPGCAYAEEIAFTVEPCAESGGYVARWNDPAGGGIATQCDDLVDLQSMVADAVGGYFPVDGAPTQVRLHFVRDSVFAIARSCAT